MARFQALTLTKFAISEEQTLLGSTNLANSLLWLSGDADDDDAEGFKEAG